MPGKAKDPDQRIRAWLLLGVNDVDKAIETLRDLLVDGDDDYVVVRVDVVQSRFCNLVVPVDVAEEYWSDFIVLLRNKLEEAGVELDFQDVARVLRGVPELHLMAHSYVTGPEATAAEDRLKDDYYKKGRNMPHSPGANPWG